MSDRSRTILGISVLIVLLVIFGVAAQRMHFDFVRLKADLLQYPFWSHAVIYIGLYVFSTSLIWFGPKDIVRVLGAILYGPMLSTILVYAAELINAGILFHLSRNLGRDMILSGWLKKREKHVGKLEDHTSLLGIVAMRFNLLFPFRFLDLGYGLTQVSFRKYFVAALIASPFRLFIVQYALALIGEALLKTPRAAVAMLMIDETFAKLASVYFTVLIVLIVAALMNRSMRIKRERRRESSSEGIESQS